jgi:hypothetical protein
MEKFIKSIDEIDDVRESDSDEPEESDIDHETHRLSADHKEDK